MVTRDSFTRKERFVALCSGLTGALANNYPEVFWWLILFFLIPIFYLLRRKNDRTIILSGFIFSFSYLSFSFFWFLQMYPVTWMGISNSFIGGLLIFSCWLILCFVISLPLLTWYFTSHLFIKKDNSFPVNLIFVSSSFVVFEALRSLLHFLISYGDQSLFGNHFTYNFLGYLVSWSYFLSPLLSFGGIYLASFVVVLINYFFYYILFENKKNTLLKMSAFIFLSTIVVFQIIKISPLIFVYNDNAINFTKAGLVTTHIVSTTDTDGRSFISKKILEDFDQNVDILVFPEASNLFLGFQSTFIPDNLSNSVILSSRKYNDNFNIEFYSVREKYFSYYEKQLLMPQGEFLITWIKDIAILLGWSNWVQSYEYERGGVRNRDETPFVYRDKYSGINTGALLCSEIISPSIYRELTSEGANILINLASHGTLHGSDILFNQNLSIAKSRALENNRYFLQATNMNPSFIVTNLGEINLISSSLIVADIPVLKEKTLYTKYGDYTLYISFLLTILLFYLYFLKKK
ncbi:MAG: hypothetical protein K9M10_04280 [Candidatus Pacebacteria bacterium]|nr:hypothetical protein [Candidatus Paceibacterota bacterium]MCF7857661.1 hypothetical protein [Candidatus Paceibacterota bacterium]